jgi:hypothetical protein
LFGANNATFAFRRKYDFGTSYRASYSFRFSHLKIQASGHSLIFKAGLVGSGVTWNADAAGTALRVVPAIRTWSSNILNYHRYSHASAPFTEQFYLFRFQDGAHYDYGWIELSATVSRAWGLVPTAGPDVTIEQYAYTTQGYLATGSFTPTGSTVPEPSTSIPTALAALALGAAGTRRWRKSREAA